MTEQDQKQLGSILWSIADQLCGAMNADDFRNYMLSFLFLLLTRQFQNSLSSSNRFQRDFGLELWTVLFAFVTHELLLSFFEWFRA